MKKKKSVVLLSGGLDSSVVLSLAKNERCSCKKNRFVGPEKSLLG